MNRLTEGVMITTVLLLCSVTVEADVFGIEDSDVVTKADDHKCSALHDQADWANNLCHIEISAIANEVTGSRWVGTAVLIAKELTDENISLDDIWFEPYPLDDENKFQVAINADKGFIIGYSFRF